MNGVIPAVEGPFLAHGAPQMETQSRASHDDSEFGALQENSGGMTRILPSNIDVSVLNLNVYPFLIKKKKNLTVHFTGFTTSVYRFSFLIK